jgi:hypothetical protein
MSDETKGRGCAVSRRVLLGSAVATIGAAAVIAMRTDSALAATKISKAAVAYQDHPQDDKRCGRCLQFQAPGSCKLVEGPISPQGFCRIFTPVAQGAAPIREVPLVA